MFDECARRQAAAASYGKERSQCASLASITHTSLRKHQQILLEHELCLIEVRRALPVAGGQPYHWPASCIHLCKHERSFKHNTSEYQIVTATFCRAGKQSVQIAALRHADTKHSSYREGMNRFFQTVNSYVAQGGRHHHESEQPGAAVCNALIIAMPSFLTVLSTMQHLRLMMCSKGDLSACLPSLMPACTTSSSVPQGGCLAGGFPGERSSLWA